ncbi:MAG: 50S ribosomal protein L32 [Desulfobacterota bacterium]|nr:50S ribosomal protein L32 [Thermodesulfobacteriota bacterium]
MAVPKKKISKSRTRTRRAHHALTPANVGTCPQCNEPKLPHRACSKCGYYKGREVVAIIKE